MAEPSTPSTSKARPLALTVAGLLAIAGLIAMPFVAGPPDGDKAPDMVRFLGHFHPVLLHLPIGVFTLILLQEIGMIFFHKRTERRETTVFPLFFGAASAIVAVIAGFLLYQGGGYEGNALAERHLWGGIAFAVVAVVVFILKVWTVARQANQAFYRAAFMASIGVMSFASHDGASITHGSEYLTQYAPDFVLKVLGRPVKAKPAEGGDGKGEKVKTTEDMVVYADIIAPIFESKCNQCHKAEKSKGKLRMDTYDLLLKGGSEGPAIEKGNSAKSNIIVRMALPKDEDEHMPPDGKPEPEPHELVLIKWWLDGGADPSKTVAQMGDLSVEVKGALAKLPSNHGAIRKDTTKSAAPADDLKAKVAALSKEFPAMISFESQESALVTFNAASLRGNLDDAGFAKFAPVYPNLVTVDLLATNVTDASIAKLSVAENLKVIRLAETGVTDASIDTLVKLKKLESVNLFGTKVTDAGVMKLAELPNLKRLYLWQTAVKPETVAKLKEKLPGCDINTGI